MARWLTRDQLAEKLGTHRSTTYRLEKRPDFPRRSRTLGAPRWSEEEVDAYMKGAGTLSKPAPVDLGGLSTSRVRPPVREARHRQT